jgi:hypothetical protein
MTESRKKLVYIGAPAVFKLQLALRVVVEAFGGMSEAGCYIVGSCLERPDFRDVDVRMIMEDEVFAHHFPNAGQHWEFDAKWLLLTVAISDWLSKETGLPVDFQFQSMSHANKAFSGRRNAIGFKLAEE